MVAKRIVPLILFEDSSAVKGKIFSQHRYVGELHDVVDTFNAQEADELVILNIGRNCNSFKLFLGALSKASSFSSIPIAAGGGVRDIEDISMLVDSGVDRVVLGDTFLSNQELLADVCEQYGRQFVVGIVNYYQVGLSKRFVDLGLGRAPLDLAEYVCSISTNSIGELLLQNISRDGTRSGLDVEVAGLINHVDVPLVLAGGASDSLDISDALRNIKVNAVACGSLFYFGDNNPIRLRSAVKNFGSIILR